MPDIWQLMTLDDGERRRFADLDAVLRLPAAPAGPKNRWRHVTTIRTAEGTWFLKTFLRTQWKNRLHFRWSQPRAADDAQRELHVTLALRQAGFDAPRPVAYGRRGAAAFYLCAALRGTSCHDLAIAGLATQDLQRQVARHCGTLLAAGFHLPDLSADHVFAHDDGNGWQLAVLDLHNGTLARRGPVPRRLARRVLRRFARSVRDLPVTWPQALRFSVRLLRAAGRSGDRTRAVLRELPPFTTAARYEAAGKSDAYATRNPARTARELALLARVWPGRPDEIVLDLPCGAGRLLPFLHERGHRVVQADGAFAMLRQARARGERPVPAAQADALSTPFADGSFDGVVMFRFLHHLTPEARRQAIAESCRTARRFVVTSFFHPCSFHHLQRRLRQIGGGPSTRFAVRLGTIATDFAAHGFTLQAKAADLPFARDLWVATFVRSDAVSGKAAPRTLRSAP